jgi:hypothetical protein
VVEEAEVKRGEDKEEAKGDLVQGEVLDARDEGEEKEGEHLSHAQQAAQQGQLLHLGLGEEEGEEGEGEGD